MSIAHGCNYRGPLTSGPRSSSTREASAAGCIRDERLPTGLNVTGSVALMMRALGSDTGTSSASVSSPETGSIITAFPEIPK